MLFQGRPKDYTLSVG
uniref:Uncharacterized protein n=1 Tax=Lepeophtheirus salmonis TaxID=72036 RepID=A0A0K2TP64_LEPSM